MGQLLPFLAMMVLLFLYESSRIRRYGGGKREMAAFAVLMFLALAHGTAMILRLPVPNPTRAIEAIFKPLGEKVIPSGSALPPERPQQVAGNHARP